MFLGKTVTLVMPCYNEEEGIERVLKKIPDFIDEIIVVDNGSNDKSVEIARKYRAKVLMEKMRGYGITLRKGITRARGEIVVIIDADDSYPIQNTGDILAFMEKEGFDFVSGCRFPLVSHDAMPLMNLMANYFISGLTRCLCGITIKDLQSGMMVFRKAVFLEMGITNNGMGFSQEFKIKSWINNRIRCVEMRIPYKRRVGKAKFKKIKDSLKNICDLLALFIVLKCK